MKYTFKNTNCRAICCMVFVLAVACKKKSKQTTTPCLPILYGYNIPQSTLMDTMSTASFGIIDLTTVTGSNIGTITTSAYANQAAFNTSENCYYTFKRHTFGMPTTILYKVSLNGTVTPHTGMNSGCYCPTYNKVTNKLYCISPTRQMVEFVVSGTTYITRSTVSLSSQMAPNQGSNITVDDKTGVIYSTTGNPGKVNIEKYTTGGTSVVVASITNGLVSGLRFNKSDNMLYAIKDANLTGSTVPDEFIKIDPVIGTVTTLSQLPYDMISEIYSACIDPCNNKYILSAVIRNSTGVFDSCVLTQFSTSGSIIQQDTTAGFFHGLYMNY